MNTSRFLVAPVAPESRPTALRWLHDHLPAEQRAGFVAALDAIGPNASPAWEGLLLAYEGASDVATRASGTSFAAAAWLQPLPGRTSHVWIADPLDRSAEALLRALALVGEGRGDSLVQYIADIDSDALVEQMALAGYGRLVELLYLFVDATKPVAANGVDDSLHGIVFIPNAASYPDRLIRIIDATYEGTRDCPALNGLRRVEDVVAGYASIGRCMPEQWRLVEWDGRDVGVLVLADHGDAGNWELVYMGVAPAARGRGLGRRLVAHAIHQAASAGAERLVLAVDATNEPAVEVYKQAGFLEWSRRTVYARLIPPRSEE